MPVIRFYSRESLPEKLDRILTASSFRPLSTFPSLLLPPLSSGFVLTGLYPRLHIRINYFIVT